MRRKSANSRLCWKIRLEHPQAGATRLYVQRRARLPFVGSGELPTAIWEPDSVVSTPLHARVAGSVAGRSAHTLPEPPRHEQCSVARTGACARSSAGHDQRVEQVAPPDQSAAGIARLVMARVKPASQPAGPIPAFDPIAMRFAPAEEPVCPIAQFNPVHLCLPINHGKSARGSTGRPVPSRRLRGRLRGAALEHLLAFGRRRGQLGIKLPGADRIGKRVDDAGQGLQSADLNAAIPRLVERQRLGAIPDREEHHAFAVLEPVAPDMNRFLHPDTIAGRVLAGNGLVGEIRGAGKLPLDQCTGTHRR